MPAYIEKSLAFVLEFTTFYNQRADDFKELTDLNSFFELSRPQQKAFAEKTCGKLSDAKKQAAYWN